MESNDIVGLIIGVSICFLLPTLIVWLVTRKRIKMGNMRKEIVLAAIEKNSDINLGEFFSKMNPPQKLLKEKLLNKLLTGCICTLLGCVMCCLGIYFATTGIGGTDDPFASIVAGSLILAVGIAFLINYFVGRKMLAKEIEAEEKQKIQQQI